MVVADVSEEVVVSAATPVLDVKRQGNVTNFDQAMLNEIPTARDPWALMQQLPGVSIGRPNVGGSESTNQAQFAARGDNGSNTMWNIDGVTITDMAAAGASTTYYDFNVFEEAQFTTGSLDSRQQTGGLGINLVTKRGTSELRGAARVFFSNDDLQGENISSELKAAGLSGNRIQQLAEYGGDAGGPLWKDRVWFWTGTSRTDIRQLAINGFPDESIINTFAARGDAQLAARTRLSFLYHRGEKLKAGRAAGVDRPPETTLESAGPDEHLQGRRLSDLRARPLPVSEVRLCGPGVRSYSAKWLERAGLSGLCDAESGMEAFSTAPAIGRSTRLRWTATGPAVATTSLSDFTNAGPRPTRSAAGREMERTRSSTSNGRACRPASASPTSRARAFHRAARARRAGTSAMSSRRTAGRSILALRFDRQRGRNEAVRRSRQRPRTLDPSGARVSRRARDPYGTISHRGSA